MNFKTLYFPSAPNRASFESLESRTLLSASAALASADVLRQANWQSAFGAALPALVHPLRKHRAAPAPVLSTLLEAHPRLLATPGQFAATQQQIATDPTLARWYQYDLRFANALLTTPLSTYSPKGGTILSTSRTVLDRVYKLAFIYRISGDPKYAARAWAELDAVANFPDWTPSDFLATAEMTHAAAIGYDWLFDALTPAQRAELSSAIVNKGLTPGLSAYTNGDWWTASNAGNWNLVSNGGMILGALAVADDQPKLASFVLNDAIASVKGGMAHFSTDDGAWYEGPTYWTYAVKYTVRMLASLQSALGTTFGLSSLPHLADVGNYALYNTGPTGQSFNYGDADAGPLTGPELRWLDAEYDQPADSYWQQNNASLQPLDLLWYNGPGTDPASAGLPLDHTFGGDTQLVDMRSAWTDPNASFVGFKAGTTGLTHGDLDAGSFVFDANGYRWASDLGSDNYDLPGYFHDTRWTYYRKRAEGQNTLVLNANGGPDQNPSATSTILRTGTTADAGFAIADLTPAYGGAYGGASSVQRGVALMDGRKDLLVQDEITEGRHKSADVWWFMHTPAQQIQVAADGQSAILTQGSQRLFVELLSASGSTNQPVFSVRPATPLATSPNPSGQASNAAISDLAIHLTGVKSTRISVWMVPLSPGESAPTTAPAVQPLKNW